MNSKNVFEKDHLIKGKKGYMSGKCSSDALGEQYYHREVGKSSAEAFKADAKKAFNPANPQNVDYKNDGVIEQPRPKSIEI